MENICWLCGGTAGSRRGLWVPEGDRAAILPDAKPLESLNSREIRVTRRLQRPAGPARATQISREPPCRRSSSCAMRGSPQTPESDLLQAPARSPEHNTARARTQPFTPLIASKGCKNTVMYLGAACFFPQHNGRQRCRDTSESRSFIFDTKSEQSCLWAEHISSLWHHLTAIIYSTCFG